jgi:HD-like signal output (HDOD) protein
MREFEVDTRAQETERKPRWKEERTVDAGELVNETSGLFSPPIIYRRLIELLDDLDSDQDEIAEVISYDPGLTVRVLTAANNVPYASALKVDDVYDAIAVIKEEDLRTLITTLGTIESFNQIDTDLVDMNDFWNHSVCCGLAAQLLAERCGRANPAEMFVAGVVHDIGQLVIYHALPELATKVLEMAGEPEEHRYHAETEIIGTTHADVGAELIESWQLPAKLREVVRFHHEPAKATIHPVETALVHIATGVTNRIEPSWKMGLAQRYSLASINPHAWTATGLSPEIIPSTLEQINVESIGVMSLIDPKSLFIF